MLLICYRGGWLCVAIGKDAWIEMNALRLD